MLSETITNVIFKNTQLTLQGQPNMQTKSRTICNRTLPSNVKMERVKIAGVYNYLKNKLMVDTAKNDQHSCILGSWICSAHLPYLPGLGFTKPSARANSPTPAERFPQLPWRMETPIGHLKASLAESSGIWRTQKPRLHPSSPVSPGGCFQKGWGVPNSKAGGARSRSPRSALERTPTLSTLNGACRAWAKHYKKKDKNWPTIFSSNMSRKT